MAREGETARWFAYWQAGKQCRTALNVAAQVNKGGSSPVPR